MAVNIYSVEQLNTGIKRIIAQEPMLGLVYVKGEISNLTYHRTGHIYFTLKDSKASINAAMFKNNAIGLKFKLKEGMEVVIEGKIDYYEPQGRITLVASRMKQGGQGTLAEQFEALKRKLYEMGMFAEEYKQPIPKNVKTLGVVTAPTGAAIHDIINVSKRRNPGIQIVLYPALVQGENAAATIIKGIKALDAYGVDAMIVGRGGGSMEDLFCFNDEELAQAIFDCNTPIISAVGHEVDYTIADFVADLRAATPSQAAELAVCDLSTIQASIDSYESRINLTFGRIIDSKKAALQNRYLKMKALSPERRLNESRQRYNDIYERFLVLMDRNLTSSKHRFNLYLERLKGLSPLDKLSQGYSYLADADGHTITSINKVNNGDIVNICVKDGEINARVLETRAIDRIGD